MKRIICVVVAFVLAIGAMGALGARPAFAAGEERTTIRELAYSKFDVRFSLGASGPDRFDCSGFVYWVFQQAGLLDRIGGKERRARGYYRYFRSRGLTYRDEAKAKVGDLVFYARSRTRISHVGIVTGFNGRGRPLVTSALVNPHGVTELRYFRLNVRFVAFGAVPLDSDTGPTPQPPPDPTPEPPPTSSADPIDAWLASDEAEGLLADAMAKGESNPRALLDLMIAGRE